MYFFFLLFSRVTVPLQDMRSEVTFNFTCCMYVDDLEIAVLNSRCVHFKNTCRFCLCRSTLSE